MLLSSALVLAAGAAAHAWLLRNPEPFFRWSAQAGGLMLYSDQPFARDAAERVLADAEQRLARTPLMRPGRRFAAFLCNTPWRKRVFLVGNRRAGGLNYAPITEHVFLSGGDVAQNRLVAPSGTPVRDERTLSYFIVHEIAHTLCQESTGLIAYWRLPLWLREGYADFVGRGSVFRRAEARQAYLADAPEMRWPKEAPYLRFNLLLGYLLEQEQLPIDEVLSSRWSQETAEARLRAFLAGESPRS